MCVTTLITDHRMLKRNNILLFLVCLSLLYFSKLSLQAHVFQTGVNERKIRVLIYYKTCLKNPNFKNSESYYDAYTETFNTINRYYCQILLKIKFSR